MSNFFDTPFFFNNVDISLLTYVIRKSVKYLSQHVPKTKSNKLSTDVIEMKYMYSKCSRVLQAMSTIVSEPENFSRFKLNTYWNSGIFDDCPDNTLLVISDISTGVIIAMNIEESFPERGLIESTFSPIYVIDPSVLDVIQHLDQCGFDPDADAISVGTCLSDATHDKALFLFIAGTLHNTKLRYSEIQKDKEHAKVLHSAEEKYK